MKINRKQALLILGSWMSVVLGKKIYSKENESEMKLNGFDVTFGQPVTISFNFSGYKKIIISYGNETIELDPKEVFEAFKHPPK